MATTRNITGWSPPVVSYGTEIVIILVGVIQQKFSVHKKLICASSRYFNTAFNGGFAETQSGVIKFPDIEPKIFGLFNQWIYATPRQIGEPLYECAGDTECHPDELLLHVYRFADYLVIPGLKCLALQQIRETFSACEPNIPSHRFTYLLFKNDELKFLQLYIVKHIGFWLSKSQDRDDWIELIKIHDKLAVQMAVEFASLDTIHVDALKVVHPSKVANREIELGMDLATLGVEARQNDEVPMGLSGATELSESSSTEEYRPLIVML